MTDHTLKLTHISICQHLMLFIFFHHIGLNSGYWHQMELGQLDIVLENEPARKCIGMSVRQICNEVTQTDLFYKYDIVLILCLNFDSNLKSISHIFWKVLRARSTLLKSKSGQKTYKRNHGSTLPKKSWKDLIWNVMLLQVKKPLLNLYKNLILK